MNASAVVPKYPWRLKEWFPDLSESVHVKLYDFSKELFNYTQTINLISMKTIPFMDAIHFADAILATQHLWKDRQPKEVYDLGSGNGFPGIVLGIIHPETKVILIEADQRKSDFLKAAIEKLGLSNVQVQKQTVEKMPAHSVEVAIARGFASIGKSILVTRKLVKKGGAFYHLKGEEWAREVTQIPIQLCSIWQPSLVADYKLPIGEVKFSLVKTDKIAD